MIATAKNWSACTPLPVAAAGVLGEDGRMIIGVAASVELRDDNEQNLPSEEQCGCQA
jgi:hypothetical protein